MSVHEEEKSANPLLSPKSTPGNHVILQDNDDFHLPDIRSHNFSPSYLNAD
jgi:hypothetical protein